MTHFDTAEIAGGNLLLDGQRDAVDGWERMTHSEPQDNLLSQDFAQLLTAGFQRISLRPHPLKAFDAAKISFSIRQHLIVGFSQRGIDVSRQHAQLFSRRLVFPLSRKLFPLYGA